MADEKNTLTEDLDWLEDLKDFNKELEEKILEANKDATKVKWNKLLPELMGAEVLMVGQMIKAEEENGQQRLNILMMQRDGHAIVPFFTSPEKMRVLVKPENRSFDVMKVNTVRFFQSIAGKACVLNPMSEYSRVFTPFEMRILAAENIEKAPPLPVVQ